ncbi:hypothetical protein HZB06_01595 [Candidatus Wolfebacteria bacterium]|nr:hypothetical protein [Candidatus Wolfebacteria bacterium]
MLEKIKIFFLIIISGFTNKTAAQTTGGSQSIEIKDPLGGAIFVQIIDKVLNYFILISIPILALMILIGGFQILTARGDPGQITTGRKTITYAVIGFLVILVSKGVALILLEIIG